MEEGQVGQVEQVRQERRRKPQAGKRRKVNAKKKTTTSPKSYLSSFLSYFPNKHPGRFDHLSEESHEIESLYEKLYQGGKVVAQLPLSKKLVAELGVRAGIPQREGFVHFSATATDHKDVFFKAHIFGPTKTITTTAKVTAFDVITLSGVTKVGGNNEDQDFIDKAAARIHGPNFEIEATYNNSLKDQKQQEFGLSYTQTITNNLFTGAALIYSLKQKVSMISLASRYDNSVMALFGTIVLPNLPGTKLFIPNRITAGTAIALDDKQKVAVEFQLNPSETQIFDSITTLFFTSNSKFSRFSISFDSMLRLGLLYQEIPTYETLRYLGAGQFSAYVDYKNAEYKIGLGTTIEI